MRACLRNHEKVVWDATNLRRDFRSMVAQLGYDYHALVMLVVLHIPLSLIFKGNSSRKEEVAREVLNGQLSSLERVEDIEAHRVAFVNHSRCLEGRGF